MTYRIRVLLICILMFPGSACLFGQSRAIGSSNLPRLIRFSGVAHDLNDNPLSGVVGITFSLYANQTGGAPLWFETQNVRADANGHYSVLLGSTEPEGLPAEIFTSEQARWIGVRIEPQAEQPRSLLVSAPYALKAGDAETLGGLPASAFALSAAAKENNGKTPANPAVTGVGTVDYIPMWDSASDIVNSILYEKSSQIGILTTAPEAALDVNGKGDIRDTLTLFPKSTDNTLAVNGTNFKVSSTGAVTFVSGQTFPGAGTITGITTASGSGLSGGGTTGALSLKIPSASVTNAMLADPKITLNANTAGGITTPGAMTLGSTYTIGLKTCTKNQVLQYNGTAWACASAGTGTITGVTTASGSGLSGGGTTGTLNLKIPSAGVTNAMLANSVLTLNANTAGGLTTPGAMTLGSTYTIGLKPCTANQVLQYSGTSWNCANAGSGTITGVTAGTGLTGGGSSGAVTLNNSGVLSLTAGTGITSTGGQTPTLSINASAIPELSAANTFTGAQTFDNTVTIASSTGPLTMTGSTSSGSGLQTVLSNTNTSGASYAVFSSQAANGTVKTQFYSDGNGTGALGVPGGYFGTYSNHPIGFFTGNADRMFITSTGLVGLNTTNPFGQLDVETSNQEAGIYVNNTTENSVGIKAFSGNSAGLGVGIQGITYASTSDSSGVEGVAVNPTNNIGLGIGVYGLSYPENNVTNFGVGVFGQTGSSESQTGQNMEASVGVWGDGGPEGLAGIVGTADLGSGGFFQNNSSAGDATVALANGGTSDVLDAYGSAGTCSIYYNGNLTCSGSINGSVSVDGDARRVGLAAIQSPQNWFEDAGTGQLVNGVAVVTFDPEFVQTVNTETGYKVFPVPNGDCKGLYVTSKTATSFEVRELGGGRSNVAFDYRIMALRKDFENVRFPDLTAHEEQHRLQMKKIKAAHPVSHGLAEKTILPPTKRMAFSSNVSGPYPR